MLVTFDTLNIWYTSLFDRDVAETPNLEQLAGEGVLFERAYTQVPLTLPSHTALLTGRSPYSLGVFDNGDRVPEEVTTLAELLSEAGFATAAFTSLGVLRPSFGLDQGYSIYGAVPNGQGRAYLTADEVTSSAVRWLEGQEDTSFFLWLHLSDPHEPYVTTDAPPDTELHVDDELIGRWSLARRERNQVDILLPPGRHRLIWSATRPSTDGRDLPTLELVDISLIGKWLVDPETSLEGERPLAKPWVIELYNPSSETVSIPLVFTGRRTRQATNTIRSVYRREVAFADHHLGVLRETIRQLGLEDDTLWIVASDHGEALRRHGRLGHAAFTREEQLRTILLLAGRGIPTRARLSGPPVLLQDLFPTVLELLRVESPREVDGRSLVGCWKSGDCPKPREWTAYGLDTERNTSSFSVYRWPFKARWSRFGGTGIYDVEDDPREDRRIAGLHSPDHEPLGERLQRHLHSFRRLLENRRERSLDPEEREMLEALGYL